ncbi:MAG: BlaI/MecI/CopY family transcriptional regulator [Acidobacteriota bacterium]
MPEDKPTKESQRRPLTPLQLELMEVIWSRGEVSASEARAALPRELARNTVRTTMERLESAGWLAHRLEGRTRLYRALVAKRAALADKAVDLVERVFGGRPEDFMSALLEHRGLEPEEMDSIEALLGEARRRREEEAES